MQKSIKSLSLKKLRNPISIVTQESILFNASIEENIFSNQNQGQHKLIEASKLQMLMSLLMNMKKT